MVGVSEMMHSREGWGGRLEWTVGERLITRWTWLYRMPSGFSFVISDKNCTAVHTKANSTQ